MQQPFRPWHVVGPIIAICVQIFIHRCASSATAAVEISGNCMKTRSPPCLPEPSTRHRLYNTCETLPVIMINRIGYENTCETFYTNFIVFRRVEYKVEALCVGLLDYICSSPVGWCNSRVGICLSEVLVTRVGMIFSVYCFKTQMLNTLTTWKLRRSMIHVQ